MKQNEIEEILTKYKTIAVVGLSRDPNKDSHKVSTCQKHGFHIIPVNPFADDVLGEKSYKSLLDIPPEIQKTIEVVNVFRPPNDVPLIVEQAIKMKAIERSYTFRLPPKRSNAMPKSPTASATE